MKYVGIWHGGASYSPSSWADHAEMFGSLQVAKRDLWQRREGRGAFANVIWGGNGKPVGTKVEVADTPAVGDDSEIWLVPFDDANLDVLQRDGYPDRIVKFGPRGGVIVEKV